MQRLVDDEYIEDPTVNNLEDECANLLGFEKGLFVFFRSNGKSDFTINS